MIWLKGWRCGITMGFCELTSCCLHQRPPLCSLCHRVELEQHFVVLYNIYTSSGMLFIALFQVCFSINQVLWVWVIKSKDDRCRLSSRWWLIVLLFYVPIRYLIPSLDKLHAGHYRCIVRNRVGAIMQCSTEVQVACEYCFPSTHLLDQREDAVFAKVQHVNDFN